MKLTILGTGNATVTECYNTCFALSDGNRHFLVDTGGGNRILKVLKDTGIQLEDIHDNFITHEHIDHLLGVIWLIRMIGQKKIGQGKYEGNLRIYCHEELARSIRMIAELTIQKKVTKYFDDRMLFVPVHHGETKEILGCPVTFFDIFSTKAKQFGFTMLLPNGVKFTCCGDEPYNEKDYEFVKKGDLLFDYDNIMHLIVSKKFENLQDAQGYAWSNYDMNFNESLKQLQNKIKREYQDIMDKLEKTNAREILKHIKQIYSLKMVRDVFDNEVGIFMPKATVDYLLKEDVNAADELADRVSEYDSADFHNENVQTAVEDIQIEKEKEFESINTYEPELEL